MYGAETLTIKSPYPGLRPFNLEEQNFFYGRERQLDEFLRKLRSSRFLAIVGSSGNGKSSFVNAMLVPRLQEGFVGLKSSNWNIAVCSPGNNPIQNLSRQLAPAIDTSEKMDADYPSKVENMIRSGSLGLVEAFKKSNASNQNLLIVVEQFEEIFTYAHKNLRNEDDAAAFVNALLNASRQKDVPIYILLTMRAGFIGACSEFRGLAEAINDGQFLMPRVKPEEIKRLILGPISSPMAVKETGLNVVMDEEVVDAIVADLGKNTDELGTLQHTLLRLWNHWIDTEADTEVPISLQHYKAIGTLKRALEKHAEEAYADLDTEEKRIVCERVFRAMIEKGSKGEYESRAVTVQELMDITERSMREVRLVVYNFSQNGRRFLIAPSIEEIDEETVVSIAHDGLIKRWGRLREWAAEEAEAAEMYGRLCAAAALYAENKGSLWIDPELKMGLKWYDPAAHDEDYSWRLPPNKNWAKRYEHESVEYDKAIQFLLASHEASQAAVKREEEVEERKEKTRRGLGYAALAIILFCLLMAGWALWEAANARRNERKALRAESEAKRQQYLAELSKEAAARQEFLAKLSSEKAMMEKAQAEKASLSAMEATAIAKAWARQANSATRQAKIKEDEALESAKLAQRREEEANAAKKLADKKAQEALEQKAIALKFKGLSLAQSIAVKSWKEENEDIQGLLAKEAYDLNAANGGKLDDAYIYEAVYKALDRLNEINKAYPDFNALDQPPADRKRVGRIRAIEIAKNNDKIYSVGSDGLLLKWKFDLYGSKAGRKDKQNKPEILSSNVSVSRTLGMSPDGKYLARGGDAAQVVICDAESGAIVQRIDANQGQRIWELKYTPNGTGIITTGDDGAGGTVINYTNLSNSSSPIVAQTPHKITSIDISSEGKYLAGVGRSSEVWIWDIQNQRREYLLNDPRSDKFATAVAFNPQGRFVAVGYQDGTMMVWDLNEASKNPKYVPEKFLNHGAKISDVTFSPNGSKLAVASLDGTATLWHIRDYDYKGYGDTEETKYKEFPYMDPKYRPIKFEKHGDWVTAVAFSHDGSRVITGTAGGHLRIWETDMTLYADQICEIIRQNLSDKSWRKYVGTDDPTGKDLYIETSSDGQRFPLSTCGSQVPQMKDQKVIEED